MRRVPAVVFTRPNGEVRTIRYGTMARAQRDAAIAHWTYPDIRAEWVEIPTLWDRLRGRVR